MKRTVLLLTAILLTIGAPLTAQWLSQPTKGIPRTAGGYTRLVRGSSQLPVRWKMVS